MKVGKGQGSGSLANRFCTIIAWRSYGCARYMAIGKNEEGIDKKLPYVHNTSYYDTKIYEV
jgi:hypothetical protein